YGPARLHLDDAIALAGSLADERLEWRARVVRAQVAFQTGEPVAARVGQEAIAVFERLDDDTGLAVAWTWMALAAGAAGDPHETEAATKALEYARAAGDKRLEVRALQTLAGRLVFGPLHSSEALSEAERLLELAAGDLRAAADVRAILSFLVAMRGDFEGARGMAAEARRALEELGLPADAAFARALAAAFIELVAARFAVAETELRAGYAVLDRLGEDPFTSSIAGNLAEVLALQDKDDEAERYAVTASEKSSDDDYDAQIRWRRAKALVLVHRGNLAEAEALVRGAVDIATGTDDINMLGDCFARLADVLAAAGRPKEAKVALEDALARYERKGNLVAAEKVGRSLTDIAGSRPGGA
ncbi:MAG: tetratricopeptide repeat protein, partial [Chloroflexi bacterium]|nr:tetratricopeptide repeat protein [Chloroflexota bacterium]